MRALALFVVLLAPLAAWPAQAQAQDGFDDPEGDAAAADRTMYGSVAGQCYVAGDAGAACATAAEQLPGPPPAGGPPELDILRVRFEDTPDTLLIELTLARVTEPGADATAADHGASYAVAWTWGDEGFESVSLSSAAGGLPTSNHLSSGGACPASCFWEVPYALEAGSPGRITWELPRALVLADVLVEPVAYAGRNDAPLGYAQYEVSGTPAWGSTGYGLYRISDVAGPGPDRAFTSAASEDGGVLRGAPAADDPVGDVQLAFAGEEVDPELDIVRYEVREDPKVLGISMEVALVDEDGPNWTTFTFQFQDTVFAVSLTPGAPTGKESAYACFAWSDNGTCVREEVVPYLVDLVPGAPGWVNLTVERADLGSPAAGTLMSGFHYVYDDSWTASSDTTGDAPVGASVYRYRKWDGGSFPPWRLAFDSDEPSRLRQTRDARIFPDEEFTDLTPPPTGFGSASADQFDIKRVEIEGIDPGNTRVTLALGDLSTVALTPGASAVYYAVAVTTRTGNFMVGYVKDDTGAQTFLCAPDTAVMSEAPRDPSEVIWQEIKGVISVVRSRGAGAGAPGAIVFEAPHSCFGSEGERFEATSIAAGTFTITRIPGTTARVHAVDRMRADAPVLFGADALVRTPWDELRETGNLLNVIGLVLAVVMPIGGVILVRRRQRAMREYLARIDAIEAETRDAKVRLVALREVHRNVKQDLVRGAITEAHYAIVERRAHERLLAARAETLAKTFSDLPYALFARMMELASDGELSQEDARLIYHLLDEDLSLTPDAKARLTRRIQVWVGEDARVTP